MGDRKDGLVLKGFTESSGMEDRVFFPELEAMKDREGPRAGDSCHPGIFTVFSLFPQCSLPQLLHTVVLSGLHFILLFSL